MPVCPVCRSQNMETAKFCGNCGNPFPRVSDTTSQLRKCEQGHIYSAVYQACPYCPQGGEAKRESNSFETRVEGAPSYVAAPPTLLAPPEFATRIDAPPLPSFPAPPGFSQISGNDLATRFETPIPSEFSTRLEAPDLSEFVTRIETPIPSEFMTRLETPNPADMLTRIEEPLKSAPTFDLVNPPLLPPLDKAPATPPPAALPRTEILQNEPIFVTRIESAPMPASVLDLDLDWPTPPPLMAPGATLSPAAAAAPPLPSALVESAPPLVRTAERPTGALADVPSAPPLPSMPSFAAASPPNQSPNRGTMMLSVEDAKKALASKGKLVGWLVSHARNPDGEDFKLHAGYNRVGANPACDIVVEDDTVSGSHAIIVFRDGRFLIKDDLSRNGTFVNNKEITEAHPLQNYDQVRVGNTSMVFVAAQKL